MAGEKVLVSTGLEKCEEGGERVGEVLVGPALVTVHCPAGPTLSMCGSLSKHPRHCAALAAPPVLGTPDPVFSLLLSDP